MKKIIIMLTFCTAHYVSHAQQAPQEISPKTYTDTAKDCLIAAAKASVSTAASYGALICTGICTGIAIEKYNSSDEITVPLGTVTLQATNVGLNKAGFHSNNGSEIVKAGFLFSFLPHLLAKNDVNKKTGIIFYSSLGAAFLANLHAELQARGVNNPVFTYIADNPVTNALINNPVVRHLRWALSFGTLSFDEKGYPKAGLGVSYNG